MKLNNKIQTTFNIESTNFTISLNS